MSKSSKVFMGPVGIMEYFVVLSDLMLEVLILVICPDRSGL